MEIYLSFRIQVSITSGYFLHINNNLDVDTDKSPFPFPQVKNIQ